MEDHGGSSRVRRLLPQAWLVLVPLSIVWLGEWCVRDTPYWANTRYDPEYAYLLNALNVLQGHSPWLVTHPGTPLIVFMAGVMGVRHAIAGTGATIRADVLTHPEAYLAVCHAAVLAVVALANAALGVGAWRLTRSILGTILAQGAVLLSAEAVRSLERVDPEPILLALSMACGGCALSMVARAQDDGRAWWRGAPAMGVLLGIGVATKFIALPVTLFALAARPSWRWRAVAAVAALVGCLVALLPIVRHWGRMFGWVSALFVHSGNYGFGERTVINFAAYPTNLRNLVGAEPVFAVLAGAGLVVGAGLWFRRGRAAGPGPLGMLLLGAGATAAAQVVITAKSPEARYLVPAVGLMGSTFAVLWALFSQSRGFLRPAALCALAAAALSVGAWQVRRVRVELGPRPLWVGAARRMWKADQSLAGEGNVAGCYGSSGPATGLYFGIYWAGSRYGVEVEHLYPWYIYSIGGGLFRRGDQFFWSPKLAEMARERPLFLHMPAGQFPQGFDLQPIDSAGNERICRVLPSPAPQGASPAPTP